MACWRTVFGLFASFTCVCECALQVPPVTKGDLSGCATTCIISQLPYSGCAPTNTTCLCTSLEYTDSVGACLQQNCTIRESLIALRYQKQTCGAPIREAGSTTRRVTWSLYTVACVTVIGRLVFRHPSFKGSGYGWDDWTIIFSLVMVTALNAVADDMTHHGLGQDVWAIPLDYITRILRFFYHGEFLYIWIMAMTKVSIVLLYLRIWTAPETGKSKFRICCFVLLFLLVVSALVLSLFLGLECTPRSYSWTRWDGEHDGHCININALVFTMAGANIALDILTFSLPIPQILRLHTMPIRRKVGVAMLFLVGLFCTICSMIRLHSLYGWETTPNPTWHNNKTALWSMVECNVSVVCACLPSLAGLFQKMIGKGSGTWYSRSRNGTRGTIEGQEEEVGLGGVGYTTWGVPMRGDSTATGVSYGEMGKKGVEPQVGATTTPHFIDI